MTITAVQVKTTKTAAFDGSGIDISGITGDWTLALEVMGLDDGDGARFQFTDTADNFSSDIVAGPTFSVSGKIGSAGTSTATYPNVRKMTIKKADFPDLRMGTASAKVRLSLTRITGSSPHVTYQAWIES